MSCRNEKIRVISARYMLNQFQNLPLRWKSKLLRKAQLHKLFRLDEARRVVLPNLKPTTKTISLRLPQHLLDSI
ncbi:CopG family antitoxin [Candidatus Nitrotoga sp. AM1P]|uniref:CopG family antitoxin n=1 Tax=Candidatus Nitrotoga sp. AM1P TaxID=2559597 RepID=UPI00403E3181